MREGTAWVANIGDSRAYLVADGAARQLTLDHSWVEEGIRAGELAPDDPLVALNRHVITRAIGLDAHAAVDVFGPLDLLPGSVLLLCTDGLHGVLDDPCDRRRRRGVRGRLRARSRRRGAHGGRARQRRGRRFGGASIAAGRVPLNAPTRHQHEEATRCPSTYQGRTTQGRRACYRKAEPRDALTASIESVGGSVDTFLYAFGGDDLYIVMDVPDNVSAAALGLAIGAAGAITWNTTVMLTPEEIDEAADKSVAYRPPGA